MDNSKPMEKLRESKEGKRKKGFGRRLKPRKEKD